MLRVRNKLPKSISDYYHNLADEKKPTSPPFRYLNYFNNQETSFYILEKNFRAFKENLVDKILLNPNFERLPKDELKEYFKEYGIGFHKGYDEFTENIKQEIDSYSIDNSLITKKVFNKATRDFRGGFGELPTYKSLIYHDDELKAKYAGHNVMVLKKEDFHKRGYESGQYYKSWEMILTNPFLYEDVFNKKSKKKKKPQRKKQIIIETLDLTLKDIPNFNLQQRYEIFTQLGYDKAIHTLDTSKGSKNKILALLMGISVDNAKHLINGTYKEFKPDDIEEFDEYLERIKVKL
jgi:hypothetical protein